MEMMLNYRYNNGTQYKIGRDLTFDQKDSSEVFVYSAALTVVSLLKFYYINFTCPR